MSEAPPGEPTVPGAQAETLPGEVATQGAGDVVTVGGASNAPGADAPPPQPGDRIGTFVIESTLGQGAMGLVLLARDEELHRRVAIKLLLPRAGGDTRGQQRLLREAQSVAQLSHPNVVALHQVGVHGASVYVVMEYVDGGTLRQWLAAGPRGVDEILDKFRQAAAGLAAAHAAGFVHRDFKPDNVLVGRDGRVRVSDFGLVGAAGESTSTGPDPEADVRLTQTGALLGTPAYMAPEQFEGASVGAAADQFALCVSLYEALHGRRPFPGTTPGALLLSIHAADIQPPLRRDVPRRVQRAIERGLARNPFDRHPSVEALGRELDPSSRRGGRGLAIGIAAATVSGLALGGGALLASRGGDGSTVVDVAAGAGPPCDRISSAIPSGWNDDARVRLTEAMREAGLGDPDPLVARTSTAIESYAVGLGEVSDRACTEVEDPEARRRRQACAHDLRVRYEATVDLVARAESPTIARDALGLIAGLAAPSRCDAAAADPPSGPADILDDARRELAAAVVFDRISDAPTAAVRADRALALARKADALGLRADAERMLARARLSAGDAAAAETLARDALAHARALGDPHREWMASLTLGTTVASQPDQTEDVASLVSVADLAAQRASARSSWEFDLAAAHVFHLAQEYDAAEAHATAAVDRLTAVPTPPPLGLAAAFRTLGAAQMARRDPDRALETYARGLAALTEIVGPDHPGRGTLLVAQGLAQTHRGDFPPALTSFAEAERIFGTDVGDNRSERGRILVARADVHRQLGQLDEAASAAAAAIEILEGDARHEEKLANALIIRGTVDFLQTRYESAGTALARAWEIAQRHPKSQEVSLEFLFAVWGGVEVARGDLDEAVRHQTQALTWLEKRHGPAHPQVAHLQVNVADMYMLQGDYDSARAGFRRSLSIRADLEVPPDDDLVRILAGNGRCQALAGDVDAAQASADRARDLLAAGTGEMYRPRIELLEAEIQWRRGQHAEARAKAQSALDRWRTYGDGFRIQQRDAAAWLDRHG